MMWVLLISIFFCFTESFTQTNQEQFVISGYVKDGQNNRVLPGATIVVVGTSNGGVANSNGFFSISLPKGDYFLNCTFLGYEELEKSVDLQKDIDINFVLQPGSHKLSEVEILGSGREEQIRDPVLGVERIDAATIYRIPVLFGEVDPLKVLQFLPGISASGEGSSNFSVRGGSPDQNLLLFDDAILYNSGHLLGFFSIFNNDIIKEVKAYKGDIPARTGGRLSSVIDVKSRDGDMHNYSGVAGLGLISSRLSIEGPVIKEKSSFLLAGRRTYLDMFLPLSPNKAIRDNKLYFYDFNLKWNYILSENDRLYLSVYNGRDVFGNEMGGMDFGNRSLSIKWNKTFNPKLLSNLVFVSNRYDYYLGSSGEAFQQIDWRSKISDFGLQYGFSWHYAEGEQIDFGLQTLFHSILPGDISSSDLTATVTEFKVPKAFSLEHAYYMSQIRRFSDILTLRYGFRVSMFQNIGSATSYNFDEQFNVIDTLHYKRGEIFNTYMGFEPRVGLSWLLTPDLVIKGSYLNTRQYIHLAGNSNSSTPLDIWFTSSPNIKPQKGNQFSIGIFYADDSEKWEHSLELYYKRGRNAIDFKDHANLMLNEVLEGEVRSGKSKARGLEWMTRYEDGPFSGWLAFTWSRSKRQSKWINEGNWYLSPFNKTYDLALVLNYMINERINLSGNWVYYTGVPVTLPVGRFEFQGNVFPVYPSRNEERMPDYHRMDVSMEVKSKMNLKRKWQGAWSFSVYNLYGRKNPWLIDFINNEEMDYYIRQAEMTYLFSIVPSVSYIIRF